MGFVRVGTSPDEVIGSAARLSAGGEALRARLAGPKAEIAAIEAEAPWGSDHFGSAFLKSYHQPVPGRGPFHAEVQAAADDLVEQVTTLGDASNWSMVTFQATDGGVATDIGRV